jgi:hypothetical protein
MAIKNGENPRFFIENECHRQFRAFTKTGQKKKEPRKKGALSSALQLVALHRGGLNRVAVRNQQEEQYEDDQEHHCPTSEIPKYAVHQRNTPFE